METTALSVAAASFFAAVAVLLLFGSIFMGRQQETIHILSALGTSREKICLWLLSGAVMIAAVAALAGSLISRLVLGKIISIALDIATDLYAVDQRYSEAAMGISIEASTTTALPLWPAIAAGLAVFVLALLFCAMFLAFAWQEPKKRRHKAAKKALTPDGGVPLTASAIDAPPTAPAVSVTPVAPAVSVTPAASAADRKPDTPSLRARGAHIPGRGALRFALLCARRRGFRSAIVPAATLCLTLLIGVLALSTQNWQRQMDSLKDNAVISGRATSANGRQSTEVMANAKYTRILWKSGMLEDMGVAISWHYWFPEDIPAFGSGGFSENTKKAWISRQPYMAAANNLLAAPGLLYDHEPSITWLDGWDEDVLISEEYDPIIFDYTPDTALMYEMDFDQMSFYPCVMSEKQMREKNLSLGDTFIIVVYLNTNSFDSTIVRLKVVGTYTHAKNREIYVPLSFWMPPEELFAKEDVIPLDSRLVGIPQTRKEQLARNFFATYFSTCRFTLKSAQSLDDFRDYLTKEGFGQTNRTNTGENRMTILLEDQSYTETVSGLERYIAFSRLLFPFIFLATGLLGFVISWLMVNGRRMEFAIMRGLGAHRCQVFLSFFLEQGLLALIGCLLGFAVLAVLGAGAMGALAVLGFLVCYLAGCALSILSAGRTNLIDLLSEKE